MVSIADLWLPIVLSAVFVFIASALMWMAAPHHKSDYAALSNEDAVADAVRAGSPVPGMYMVPHHKLIDGGMKSPQFAEKANRGPVMWMTVAPNGMAGMGLNMVLSFLVYLAISFVLAFIAHGALSAGAQTRQIWCVIGGAAGLAYTAASLPNGIWFWTPRSAMAKNFFDGIVYAVITAATFVWLWPST